ncbi:MFS transporter [Streptomyces sp. IBSBF 2394]|uniref:MFS transporter n=1 Tax=Streptomyces sp. IBSBF 2394 TaxID=2903532 RepID=UPI003FA71FE1
MARDLHTSATSIQLTLTMFLLGLAAGQPFFGPLSDRYGRRGPLLAGAVVLVVANILAAIAPTINALLIARLVQGLSVAAGVVIGRPIIADLEPGRAAVQPDDDRQRCGAGRRSAGGQRPGRKPPVEVGSGRTGGPGAGHVLGSAATGRESANGAGRLARAALAFIPLGDRDAGLLLRRADGLYIRVAVSVTDGHRSQRGQLRPALRDQRTRPGRRQREGHAAARPRRAAPRPCRRCRRTRRRLSGAAHPGPAAGEYGLAARATLLHARLAGISRPPPSRWMRHRKPPRPDRPSWEPPSSGLPRSSRRWSASAGGVSAAPTAITIASLALLAHTAFSRGAKSPRGPDRTRPGGRATS